MKPASIPSEYFKKYPGRFPLVHIKDFDKNRTMVDVGKGEIDWKAILAKSDVAGNQALLRRVRQSRRSVRKHSSQL